MKIMIFLHGTIIMQKSGLGVSREERVEQVKNNESSVLDYGNYIPVGHSAEKLNYWHEKGAEIIYLSSHKNEEDIKKDIQVLTKYNFPKGPVLYRKKNQTYAFAAEKVMPNILIEDDCESIGGEVEMTYPHINIDKRKQIKSIVVKEFSGIDHLPNSLEELKNYG